ncbi:MAG: hypothetical protein J5611_02760 [Alphaproteobacteria bacterium]|nr:hypothetical protein [Alphaproteobacteria bacterium]
MKHSNLFLTVFFGVIPTVCAAAPKCSQTNITRCLDSACAINIGMNPAARCQYCGTSLAGTPPKQQGLKNISVGQSSKYALTDKELAVAPSDPGKRYIWATTECIKKVGNCTADDVSNIYDKLIEQSCKAAGATVQTDKAIATATQKPSELKCTQTLENCIETKCGRRYEMCTQDSDLDRIIAECATAATGCDEYVNKVKNETKTSRNKSVANAQTQLRELVQDIQTERKNRWNNVVSNCQKKTDFTECKNTLTGAFNDKIAELLCAHYKTACDGMTGNIKVPKGTVINIPSTNQGTR